MLFDGPADLPTATLRSRASEARHRVLAADLHGWLANRWSWVRPRTVPLLVAFAGMLAILGATKYLAVYAYNGDLRLRAPASITNFGRDVASNNPAVPGLATSRLQPAAEGNAVVPPLDSDQVHGHERRGHGRCSHARMPSAELTAEPPPPGSPGELTPGRPASRR